MNVLFYKYTANLLAVAILFSTLLSMASLMSFNKDISWDLSRRLGAPDWKDKNLISRQLKDLLKYNLVRSWPEWARVEGGWLGACHQRADIPDQVTLDPEQLLGRNLISFVEDNPHLGPESWLNSDHTGHWSTRKEKTLRKVAFSIQTFHPKISC